MVKEKHLAVCAVGQRLELDVHAELELDGGRFAGGRPAVDDDDQAVVGG